MTGISVCMIVKNEVELLPACLASVRPFVDEICVVDTGSTDGTPDVALAAGARVEHHAWQNDFSLARNASLAMAQNPWILVVDADERLDGASSHALRTATQDAAAFAFMVIRDDLRPKGEPDQIALVRLFRNLPQIRYARPVHEDVTDSLAAIGLSAVPKLSGVHLTHLGYLPAALTRCDKLARNLAILRQRCSEAPADLFSAYKFAVSLPESAIHERQAAFAAALALVDAQPLAELDDLPFLPRLFEAAAEFFATTGHVAAALALCIRGTELFPDALLFRQYYADLLRRVGEFAAAGRLQGSIFSNRELCAIRAESLHAFRLRSSLSALAFALDEQVSLRPAVPATTEDVAVRCAYLRWAVQQGHHHEVARALGPLLQAHFERDDIKLLAGEFAWASGDRETAWVVWGGASASSEAGYRAHTWLSLVRAVRGETYAGVGPARDVASAALDNLLVQLGEGESAPDPVFEPSALARWTERWLSELRHAGRQDLADRGAARIEKQATRVRTGSNPVQAAHCCI